MHKKQRKQSKMSNIGAKYKNRNSKLENCFKWREWLPNSKGPLFKSNQFALPKAIEGVTEADWVTSCHEFLKSLPETERNIILKGDPEQKFDP
jgi:hypothetical protein